MILEQILSSAWRIYIHTPRPEYSIFDDIRTEDEIATCAAFLERVAEHGPQCFGDNRTHHVCDDPKIWQFDVTGTLRLLWFYDAGKVIVVGRCFYKQGGKKGKTPATEIQAASTVYNSYIAAKAAKNLTIKE